MQQLKFAILAALVVVVVLIALDSVEANPCSGIGYNLSNLPSGQDRKAFIRGSQKVCKKCCKKAGKINAYFHMAERRECRCTNGYNKQLSAHYI